MQSEDFGNREARGGGSYYKMNKKTMSEWVSEREMFEEHYCYLATSDGMVGPGQFKIEYECVLQAQKIHIGAGLQEERGRETTSSEHYKTGLYTRPSGVSK